MTSVVFSPGQTASTGRAPWGLGALADLIQALESAAGIRERRRLVVAALQTAPDRDAGWLLRLLSGERLKQLMPATALRMALHQASGLPDWLIEESYQAVGDLAETAAMLAPAAGERSAAASMGLADWVERQLLPLQGEGRDPISRALMAWWAELSSAERFCLNKLVTGGFRVGVSRGLVAQALADWTGHELALMTLRLMRFLAQAPTAEAYQALLSAEMDAEAGPEPLPFFLAQSFQGTSEELLSLLGAPEEWLIEWKWDGIRAQLLLSQRQPTRLWSRGEEAIEESFPELALELPERLAEVVLDGEVLVWLPDQPSPQSFADLQARLGRRRPSAALCRRSPAVMVVYDLLWMAGEDLRALAFVERRRRLEEWYGRALQCFESSPPLRLSPLLAVEDWTQAARLREQAEALSAEGLMLKYRQAAYGQGRTKSRPQGEVWKWKRDPFQVDAVLITAQRGHGRRAGLYTDYGFAVWDDRQTPAVLVPFAKAYSGLTDEEIRWVDRRIRETIEEQFGPVRQVRPTLVMELGFEGIARSSRHRSGVAVRFPRILRLREDKAIEDADRLSQLEGLLP